MPIDGVVNLKAQGPDNGEAIFKAAQERLAFLRPYVAEYERLTGAMSTLAEALSGTGSEPQAKAKAKPAKRRRPSSPEQAAARRAEIQAFAAAQNGGEFSATDLAAALGVSPQALGPSLGTALRDDVIRIVREDTSVRPVKRFYATPRSDEPVT